MLSKIFFSVIILFSFHIVLCQNTYMIKGQFLKINQQEIVLKKYSFNEEEILTKTKTDSSGVFKLNYPDKYIGAAIIEVKEGPRFILLLNKENITLKWSDINNLNDLKVINSKENDILLEGMNLYNSSESKMSGLMYLKPLYMSENSNKSKNNLKWINAEIEVQKKVFSSYLNKLSDSSYAKYYLNLRRFITDMKVTPLKYGDRISENEAEFLKFDFSDNRLINSGLFQDMLESYVALMESYGESSQLHINKGVDVVLNSFDDNPSLKQIVAENMFKLLEKRSLYKSAEYLALKMLDDNNSCLIDENHKALFEQYRKMAKGNRAPEIIFSNSIANLGKLSDLRSKFKLVVFGASWCNKCVEEIPKLFTYYKKWKNQYDIEVVFISLDKNRDSFEKFTKDFTWISSCDFKDWEGTAVKDYYVFGTPTMYLLDSENKIILKPIFNEQVDSWLKYFK